MEENSSNLFAEKAFDLCRKAYRAKNISLARVYALNAITHNSNIKYLDAYLSIITKLPVSERREAIEQALNIYVMAMYHCDPDDVIKIQNLIEKLEDIQDDSFNADVLFEDTLENPSITNGELIDKYSWASLKKIGKIENIECIREKSLLFQQMLDSGKLSATRHQQCEREFKESLSLLDYLTKKEIFNNTIIEIKNELELLNCNVYYVAARIQNAASILSQLWLLDVSNIIPEIKSRLNVMALNLENLEKRYNKFKSANLFTELKSKLQNAISKKIEQGAKITPLLENLQRIAQDVSPRLCELSDSEAILELQKLLNKLNSTAESLVKNRYALYQEFCAEKCCSAIKSYDDTVGRVSEADAIKYLDRWEIEKIDESLLSPEASGIFQTAKGILIEKLSRIHKAEYQIKCVTSEKFKLEDF